MKNKLLEIAAWLCRCVMPARDGEIDYFDGGVCDQSHAHLTEEEYQAFEKALNKERE